MWPFRKRPVEPPEARVGAAVGAGRRDQGEAGWASLPRLDATLRPPATTVAVQAFADGLASWQRPQPFLAPLGHAISPDGPAGLIAGIAAPVPAPASAQAQERDAPPPVGRAPAAPAPAARTQALVWPRPFATPGPPTVVARTPDTAQAGPVPSPPDSPATAPATAVEAPAAPAGPAMVTAPPVPLPTYQVGAVDPPLATPGTRAEPATDAPLMGAGPAGADAPLPVQTVPEAAPVAEAAQPPAGTGRAPTPVQPARMDPAAAEAPHAHPRAATHVQRWTPPAGAPQQVPSPRTGGGPAPTGDATDGLENRSQAPEPPAPPVLQRGVDAAPAPTRPARRTVLGPPIARGPGQPSSLPLPPVPDAGMVVAQRTPAGAAGPGAPADGARQPAQAEAGSPEVSTPGEPEVSTAGDRLQTDAALPGDRDRFPDAGSLPGRSLLSGAVPNTGLLPDADPLPVLQTFPPSQDTPPVPGPEAKGARASGLQPVTTGATPAARGSQAHGAAGPGPAPGASFAVQRVATDATAPVGSLPAARAPAAVTVQATALRPAASPGPGPGSGARPTVPGPLTSAVHLPAAPVPAGPATRFAVPSGAPSAAPGWETGAPAPERPNTAWHESQGPLLAALEPMLRADGHGQPGEPDAEAPPAGPASFTGEGASNTRAAGGTAPVALQRRTPLAPSPAPVTAPSRTTAWPSPGDVALRVGAARLAADGSFVFRPPAPEDPRVAEAPTAPAIAWPAPVAHFSPSPVVQRVEDPAPPPPPPPPATVEGQAAAAPASAAAAAPAPGATGASGASAGGNLDDLARKLYPKLRPYLRKELWLDRERAGVLTDMRW